MTGFLNSKTGGVMAKLHHVTLTEPQVKLLLDLLFDHREDGSYWGTKAKHYDLIEKTRKALVPEDELRPTREG